jgi:hypothetical protein
VSKKDLFPLPLVEECIDVLSGNMWFSKLDVTRGYWQIKMREEKCKTAFTTRYGLFQFKRMAFGLTNAPSTFSRVMNFMAIEHAIEIGDSNPIKQKFRRTRIRVMNLVLRGLHCNIVLAFLDDVLVLGRDFSSHVENL